MADESDIYGNRTAIRTAEQNRTYRHADFNAEKKECQKKIAELDEELKYYKDIIERETLTKEKLSREYIHRENAIQVMRERCAELGRSLPPPNNEGESLRKTLEELTDANRLMVHEKERIGFSIQRLDDDLQSDMKESEIYRRTNNKLLRDIAHLQRRKTFFADNIEARNEFAGKISNTCETVKDETVNLNESERNGMEQLAGEREAKTLQCSQWFVEIGALDKEAKKLNENEDVASALYEKHKKDNVALKKKENRLEREVANKTVRSMRRTAREEERRQRQSRPKQSRWN